MAGGNPLSVYDIAGFKIPRYRLAMMVLGLYTGVFAAFKLKGALSAPPPIAFESKEEEDYVRRYIAHKEAEEHKPKLLRVPFTGKSVE